MKQTTLATVLRHCADIGMFALDRRISSSCVHRTSYCDTHCFNNKLFAAYPAMHGKDARNESAWADNDAQGLAVALSRKRKQTKRARLMTRGEAFSNHTDVTRVENILRATPGTIWWVPTRAWRNAVLWARVQDLVERYSNIRVLASLDPSNTPEDWSALDASSIMFFGDETLTHNPSTGRRMFKCPKTHAHIKGHCATCKAGCFKNGIVNVHLSQH